MSEIQAIAQTIMSLAAPDMEPKDLIYAVRKKHPESIKKEIIRAAFYGMIAIVDNEPNKAFDLQKIAFKTRASQE